MPTMKPLRLPPAAFRRQAPTATPAWSRSFFTSAASPAAPPRPMPHRLLRAYQSLLRPRCSLPSPLLRPFRRLKSSNADSTSPKPDPTPHLGSPTPLSFTQRMRKLSREYGWVALGVYLGLSVLDFPFCFLAVRMLGTDRIGRWEHAVVQAFWTAVHIPFPDMHTSEPMPEGGAQTEVGNVRDGALGHSAEVTEAQMRNSGDEATIWTQLALAYAIHKSFIFLRVPLTAAVTPKVVKVLRRWGWDIGKKKPKA